MKLLTSLSVGCGLLLLPILAAFQKDDAQAPPGGRYVGSAMCKNCHNGPDKGDAFDHWARTPHAKAYESLASDEAKAVAKRFGIDDPQKSDKCLKCHVTAYGVDKKELRPTFKIEQGVQCESCHGPGENHQRKRLAEASKPGTAPSPITPDEIVSERSVASCTQCHNEESPTYKPFCLAERMVHVEHLDPRKKRSEEELGKLRKTCSPDCKICKDKGGHDK